MRRKVSLYGIGTLLLLTVAVATYHITKQIKISAVLAAERAPYTIWYRDATYRTKIGRDIDYNVPHDSVTFLKARKTDGSVSEITFASYTSPEEFKIGMRRVSSMPDGHQVVAYPRSKVKTTLPLRKDELAALKALPTDSSCIQHPEQVGSHRFLGTDTVQGISVVKHELKPSSRATWEVWEAPELDCATVYVKTTLLAEDGEVTGATIRTAVAIQKQDPEAWIFADDTGEEMAPARAFSVEKDAAERASGRVAAHRESPDVKLRLHDEDYFSRWRELRSK